MSVKSHILNYLLHHACRCTGGPEYVLQEGPFYSAYDETTRQTPFLGSGYYFWDDNLEMARKWGRIHYENNYFVIEADCRIPSELVLDLVGNRTDLRFFCQCLEMFKAYGHARECWSVSQIIEFMKKLSVSSKNFQGMFPFQAIRAVDHSAREAAHEKIKFSHEKERGQYMLTNPRILVCFPHVKRVFLDGVRLIKD
jgi:hypothetical protein